MEKVVLLILPSKSPIKLLFVILSLGLFLLDQFFVRTPFGTVFRSSKAGSEFVLYGDEFLERSQLVARVEKK